MAAESAGMQVVIGWVMEGAGAVDQKLNDHATKVTKIGTASEQAGKTATKAMGEIASATAAATKEVEKYVEALNKRNQQLKDAAKLPAGPAREAANNKLDPLPAVPSKSSETLNKWNEDIKRIVLSVGDLTKVLMQVESVAKQIALIELFPGTTQQLANEKAILAQSGAMQKARAEMETYSATARVQIATDKELLSVKQRLNDLQGKQAARQDPGYQKEAAELQRLTRAEMEKVAVDKLIDKLYQDRARIIAHSSDAYKQEAAGLAKLTMEQRVAAETAKQLEIQQQRLAKAQALSSPAVRALVKEYEKLTKQQQHAAVLTSGLSDRISGANQIAAGFRAALSGIGMGFGIYTSATIVAASATYAVVAAFRDWVSTGAEFEKEMARVNAAMNLTSEQYDDLSRRAVAMAETSRFTTGEIVKAYREMAMSGFSYQETVDGIQSVMAMASIGMMEFGEAADIATNVLFGFNLEAKDLSSVVDVLATTITNSAQDLQQLGNTMSYVAPVAASYGISLQMVAAATEVLANAGIKGSRSGTGLRRTLTALFSDSEKADTALGNLGVHVNTLAQDMDQELLRVLRELNKATNGATTNVGELNTAVGIYAIPTFLNLVKAADESVTSLDALAKKYDDVSGAAFGMQKRMEDALAVDWEKAMAAWSAIKTELFLLFGGNLREFVQDLTAWIRGLADSKDVILETIDLLKELLKTVTLVTGAILGLSMAKGAGNLLGAGIGAGKNLIGAIGQKAPALAATTLAAGGAAEVAAIKATTELTKDAVKQTGAWAASKKLLGVAMRAVPYAGTLLILKDIYDIYVNLTKITPKQAEEVTKLADAQQILNERLRGFKLLSSTEASAAAAASAQKSYDDTRASLRALGDDILDVESQLNDVLKSATPGSQADRIKIQVLMEDLDALRKKYNDMVATSKESNAKLNNATRSLMESSRVALEREALALERLRDTAKKELEAAQQRMKEPVYAGGRTSAEEDLAKYKQMFEDLGSIGQYLRGFDTFAEYLEEVAPGLARVSAGLVKAEEDLEAASKKSDRFSNSLKEQRYRLGQAAEGVEAYDASLDAVRQAAEYSNKIEGFFKDTAKAIEDVAEANRLENMTMEEKKQHFQGLITKYADLFASTKALAAETADLTIQLVLLENAKKIALADNSWTGGQEATLLAVQERLATLSKNMQTLSEQKGARLEWGKELNGLKDDAAATTSEVEQLTKSTNDLRQSILELFTMDDADFPDTLSGNFEKLLKQSEALRTNIEKIRSGEIAVGKSSGGMYGGSGTVNVSGGGSAAEIMSKYGGIIRQASEKFALDIKLLIAVIQQESGGNPNAVSPAGARGLMQIMPGTAADLGVTNAFDPFQNIMAGAKYLRQQVSKFGDLEWALAAYNAGPGAAESRGPDLSKYKAETQDYVPSVLARIGKIGDIGDAAAEVDKVTTAVKGADDASKSAGKSIQGVDTAAQAATQSAKVWSEGLQLSAEEMGAAVEKMQADWDAASQRQLGPADADRYKKELDKVMAARVQNRKDLEDALRQMNSGPITEQEIAKFEALTAAGKDLSQQYSALRDQAVPMYEELIKQGYDYGDSLKYNKAQLEALAEGYDSVYTRARQYNLVMVQIQKLEEGGYLTKSEAALAKIDARFENLDPLTKDVATNIMNTLKNVATGASSGSEAMKDLRQSLVDIAMEKYVVKIGLDIVGSVMKPFLKSFEHIAFSMLSGLGSLLSSGLGAMTGGGATGMTGGGGAVGGVTSGLSGLSSLTSIGSMFSTAYSLGGVFLSGVYEGFAGLLTTNAFATMGGAMGAIGSGSSVGMAAGAGVLAVYALPIIIAAAAIFSKYQKDQKPRVGAFAATTHGGVGQLEDSIGVAGGFGLTFGVNDRGSANIDAEEMREAFEGFAQVSLALEQFYGHDVAAEVETTLQRISQEHYAKTGILNYAMDMNDAFDIAFTQIIDAAAATGDSVAVVMKTVVGDLTGTTENMASQIETAMQTTNAVIQVAKAMEGTDSAKILELGDDLTANALRLVDYARSMQWSGEELSATLGRMGLYLTGLDTALQLTGTQTEATGQDFIDLARNLAYAADEAKIGIEGLIQLQNSYYEHFFSEEERALKAKEAAYKAINAWNWNAGNRGEAAITTSADLRKYIETLNQETEAGRAAYVEAMKITAAFIALDEALATLNGTTTDTGTAIDNAAAIAEERAGLEMRLLELVGTESQILAEKRRLELAAVDESNRAILQRIHMLEDEAAAAERAAAAAAQMASLTERLYAAAGDDAMVTELQRQAELSEALSDGARAMLLMIYAVEDSAAAASAANQQAEEVSQAANDAASAAAEASQEAAREQADAVQELVSTLQSLRDALKSAIEAIFIETPLTRVSTRDEAQEQITAALVAARGGVMPDLEKLSPYLDVVSQDAEAQFATLEEYQRDAYRTRADLVELEALIGDQQTIEEQTLEALNTIINEALPSAEDNADANADKIALNVQNLIAIAEAISEGVLRMDTDLDGVITFAEMQTALAGLATDAELQALFTMLDTNGDGVLSALEAMPLKIAQNLTGMFDLLDTDLDGLLTFSELQIGLGPLATDEQIQAMMVMMDANHDGLISVIEALRYQIISDSNILFAKMDVDSNTMLTKDEFLAGVAGMASDETLISFWHALDLNHDGLLTATEAIPLQIATSLSSYFNTLDNNTDGLLTYAELQSGLSGLATNTQIQQLILAVDANGDGMISEQEAATFKLGTLNATATQQYQELIALRNTEYNTDMTAGHTWEALGKQDNIIAATTTGNSYLGSINNAVWQIKDQLVTSNTHLADIRVSDYNSRLNLKRIVDFGTAVGGGYATGGIADGPLSGYGATLHGREAVIPLGDGNSITAQLVAPPPNYIAQESGSSRELRAALAELQAELAAMRRDQQAIGATTVGELKDHNRRERRRDVVPQQVQVVS